MWNHLLNMSESTQCCVKTTTMYYPTVSVGPGWGTAEELGPLLRVSQGCKVLTRAEFSPGGSPGEGSTSKLPEGVDRIHALRL